MFHLFDRFVRFIPVPALLLIFQLSCLATQADPRVMYIVNQHRNMYVYILTNWGLYFGAEGVERWKVKTTEYN